MRRIEPAEGWPDLSDATLTTEAGVWLAPRLTGLSRLSVSRVWTCPPSCAACCPGTWPGGWTRRCRHISRFRVRLPRSTMPSRFQSLPRKPRRSTFDHAETRRGPGTLQLALLSPAGRPVAITADLAGFWQRLGPRSARHARTLSQTPMARRPVARQRLTGLGVPDSYLGR